LLETGKSLGGRKKEDRGRGTGIKRVLGRKDFLGRERKRSLEDKKTGNAGPAMNFKSHNAESCCKERPLRVRGNDGENLGKNHRSRGEAEL